MLKVKAYIRALNNKERKNLYNICFASFFQSIKALLCTVLLYSFKMDSLVMISLQGSLMTIGSFIRILIDLHEDPDYKTELFEVNKLRSITFMGIIISFLLIVTVFTLNKCTMSTVFLIFRLSQFIAMLFIKKNNNTVQNEDLVAFFISIIGFILIIYYPSYYHFGNDKIEHTKGVSYAIVACLILTYLQVSNEKGKTKNVDPQIFVSGVCCAIFGCFFSIILDKDFGVGFWTWMFLFVTTAFMYFGTYFKIKSIKGLVENRKFIPFNFIPIIITLVFGLIFFGQSVSWMYFLGLLVSFINVLVYSNGDSQTR